VAGVDVTMTQEIAAPNARNSQIFYIKKYISNNHVSHTTQKIINLKCNTILNLKF
jgi:hypothetical protein